LVLLQKSSNKLEVKINEKRESKFLLNSSINNSKEETTLESNISKDNKLLVKQNNLYSASFVPQPQIPVIPLKEPTITVDNHPIVLQPSLPIPVLPSLPSLQPTTGTGISQAPPAKAVVPLTLTDPLSMVISSHHKRARADLPLPTPPWSNKGKENWDGSNSPRDSKRVKLVRGRTIRKRKILDMVSY
jgi:hypothetical protein